MDIEGGKTYNLYMSYYLNKVDGTKTSGVKGDKSGKGPKFVSMPISNVVMPKEKVEENNYTVKSGSLRGFATLGALAMLAANMQ